MSERRNPLQTATVCAIAVLALAACSGTPAATSGPGSTATAAPGATTASGATTPPAATAAPTVAATTAPTKALPTVDLTLSGVYPVVVKGTAGICTLLKDSAGIAIRFGFGAVEADYTGLGDGLFVSEGNNGFVTIKWLVASVGFINIADVKGVSADHHSITIDADLGGRPGTEHVKGTISCP